MAHLQDNLLGDAGDHDDFLQGDTNDDGLLLTPAANRNNNHTRISNDNDLLDGVGDGGADDFLGGDDDEENVGRGSVSAGASRTSPPLTDGDPAPPPPPQPRGQAEAVTASDQKKDKLKKKKASVVDFADRVVVPDAKSQAPLPTAASPTSNNASGTMPSSPIVSSGSFSLVNDPVKALDEVDLGSLHEYDTFNFEQPKIDAVFLVSVLGLVLSIVTMMSAAKQFADDVRGDIDEQSKETFWWLEQILTYFPLIYSPMLVLIYNSKMSRDVYHEYLRHGYLVDFPDSGAVNYLVSHPYPLAFLLVTLAYSTFAAFVFIQYFAPVTLWIIFFKQLLFEIILCWHGIQTIEDKVITLSHFVEAFDDRDDEKVIDNYTTSRAAELVTQLRPLQSRPSYKAYTEKYGVRRRPQKIRMLIRVLMIVFILLLCVGAVALFRLDADSAVEASWKEKLNPCAQVCFDAFARQASECFNCVCKCATVLGLNLDKCEDYVAVPGCPVSASCTGTCE